MTRARPWSTAVVLALTALAGVQGARADEDMQFRLYLSLPLGALPGAGTGPQIGLRLDHARLGETPAWAGSTASLLDLRFGQGGLATFDMAGVPALGGAGRLRVNGGLAEDRSALPQWFCGPEGCPD